MSTNPSPSLSRSWKRICRTLSHLHLSGRPPPAARSPEASAAWPGREGGGRSAASPPGRMRSTRPTHPHPSSGCATCRRLDDAGLRGASETTARRGLRGKPAYTAGLSGAAGSKFGGPPRGKPGPGASRGSLRPQKLQVEAPNVAATCTQDLPGPTSDPGAQESLSRSREGARSPGGVERASGCFPAQTERLLR